MNAIVQTLNTAGRAFVGAAAPMLIQSSLLILILLALDAVLRRRVRAVFRYWIWILVLVKLVLPPSLWSPVSVGTWFGDTLEAPTAALLETPLSSPEEQGQDALARRLSPAVASFLSASQRVPVAPLVPEPGGPAAPGWSGSQTRHVAFGDPGPITPEGGGATRSVDRPPAFSLNWQGFVLLIWASVVGALLLLLAQRTFFVRGLVKQAEEASHPLLHELDQCRQHLGVRGPISVCLSPHAASPAVCGLWRPVILIPQDLAARLHGTDLRAVLLHELAHVRRGDLWINRSQTLLQIAYFYNPLLWLANAVIRRIREQAVDETVLVALGEAAPQYPDTLIHVAQLALARRPALSLRLIGVVESQSALTGRIRHILSRPFPKTAKPGAVGVIVILTTAAILLPMAKGRANQARIAGIEESLDISDKAGQLRIGSLHMAPPAGRSIVGTNEAILSVRAENTAAQETYLGLEYYTDSGTVAGVFSPGASSGVQVAPVPANWQGILTYYIHYSRFVEGGYIRILLAECRAAQTSRFLSPEAEVLYDKKYPIFPEEERQTAEPTDDPSAVNLNEEPEALRYNFPDFTIEASCPNPPRAFLREYRLARSALNGAQGTPTESQRAESRRIFEALSRQSDAFPINLCAQRWVIILDWLSGEIDAVQAAQRMNALAEAQSHVAESNLTKAYAATILARDGHLNRAHDLFVSLSPSETPQWGWFAFEMDRYLSRRVEACAPNVTRVVDGTLVQTARTREQWQAIEMELRTAQTAYADYLEYELLPLAATAVTSQRAHPHGETARLQITDALRVLLVQHTRCLRLGASTHAIEARFERRIAPKILAAWYRNLELFNQERPDVNAERQVREIQAHWAKLNLAWDSLPDWWQRIQADAQNAPSNTQPRWAESGRMPQAKAPETGVTTEPARPAVDGGTTEQSARDSDGDGRSDFDEVHKYLTDPTKKDSDGDGIPDGDWNERREYTYSVRTVLRYLPPFHEEGLNDDFQDGRVLEQTTEYIEIEVVHYPFATGQQSIPEDRNWRQEDARMTEYLAPGAATNWDEPMRRDLLAALQADGIDVETLTDKQVVERVSRWALDRSRYLDQAFTTWFVYFPQGRPTVYPGLEDAFRRDFERGSGNYSWTLDQHLDHEVLGKGMFYNKTHGSCTSTAVYLTTVLRALGIPTRMVMVAPCVDASDRSQILMVKNAMTHHRVRLTMLAGLSRASHGTTNHVFNEVYLGHRWCRLDYSQLGGSNFGLHRFGLQTRVYTFNDLSDANLAPTWGRRYAQGEHSEVFRHDNPYTTVEVSELFGPHGHVPNPPCTAQELDPHSQPDVFLFYPSRGGGVWGVFVDIVRNTTANKTGRYQLRESYENLFDGTWLVRPQDILVLLFSLDTPERVPEGYEDLLPKPWPEIESQLQQGQTVELSGKMRGMNVILLAAPTADGLKPLVQNSQLLKAIGGASSVPSAGPTHPSALVSSAGQPVKLANGARVELLGICEYPSEGKSWWRPDGAALKPAPYQTTRNTRKLQEGFRDYELVVRYGGAPDMDIEWSVPDSASTGVTGRPYDAEGRPLDDLTVCTVRFPRTRTAANVRIGVAAGTWETRAVHRAVDREGTCSLAGSRAVAFGIAHIQEGRTLVPVTTNFSSEDIDFRVVAVREQDETCIGGLSGVGGGTLHGMTYLFRCPLSEIKEFRVQTRPWTWVEFRNVALRPGLRTQAQVESLSVQKTQMPPRRSPGTEKVLGIGPTWEVLREALPGRYQGSIGGFSTDPRRCAEYFEKVLSWTHPGDVFVLMLAFDQSVGVPPEYRDLLPLPWSEIESRVRKGESVAAQGEARGLTVIALAAPTSEHLSSLIRQTHLLDPFRPKAAEASAAVASSPAPARSADAGASAASASSTDQEKEIVLPDVDVQPQMLDLATAKLVPVPTGSPEEIWNAIEKLGHGDFVYDSHKLILVRRAASPQAHPGPVAPFQTYDIEPPLPADLLVTTAEGRQYKITILAANDKSCAFKYRLISTDKGAGGGALAAPGKPQVAPNEDRLQQLLDAAPAGGVVTIPKGRYTMPVEITKPVTLRGESTEGCVIEVTADQPALLVNTQGQGQVVIENLTIRWQLAGNEKGQLPAALLVKGTNAVIRNCRFAPLGDSKRSPMAVYIEGRSKSTVVNCRFTGFEYVVCYGPGTEGTVQDCLIADCGHQGVINYDGSTLTVQRNIISGSRFHAVRCTGGTLHVKDNLLLKNANRGVYLGNKTGRGTITNNLILGNGTGISGFARATYAITNNVIAENSYAGIDMRDSCMLDIHNNVFVKNQRGLMLHQEGARNNNTANENTYWKNATGIENFDRTPEALQADPQFVDPNHGDFSVRGPAQQRGHGLVNPQIIKELWKRYEQLQAEPGRNDQNRMSALNVATSAPTDLSGRVVDPNSHPLAGAQVALCTKDKGVDIQVGGLSPTKWGGKGGEIVKTDAEGGFSFPAAPAEFHLIAAHDRGFAWVTDREWTASDTLRLEPWARIDGTVKIGRELGAGKQVGLLRAGNRGAADQNIHFDCDTYADAGGRFAFERVPPTWMEVGYMIRVGDSVWSDTSRTTIHLHAGENRKLTLGGQGRPVVGRFVPPEGYQGPVYFGAGLRALDTWRPEPPKPDNYEQMSRREQQEWINNWVKTPAAEAFYDKIWHDVSRRHYTFRTREDGRFRIEDVIPGKYNLTVWLEERLGGQGRPEEIGGYHGTVEVPPMTQAYLDEPLDLGDLTLKMRSPPLHVGDMAPLFEAKNLDGQDLRLIDYRGQFVLLSFWQPAFHPELDRLKELHQTYGGAGPLRIIGLGGWDTREEVTKLVAERRIGWPEIYLGEGGDDDIIKRYGDPVASYIVLLNPDGKIVATWLRGEKLMDTVRDALKSAPAPAPTASRATDATLSRSPDSGTGALSRAAEPAPGAIQQRIDDAAPGATIRLEPGEYRERLVIDKPLILEGAGWDQTTLLVESRAAEEFEKIRQTLKANPSAAEVERLRKQFTEEMARPVLTVTGAPGVTIRGLKFSSPGRRIAGSLLPTATVKLSRCDVRLSDCAVVAGPGDGVRLTDQSRATLEHCLVAAVWGTGVVVGARQDVCTARLTDSDIRNCHYAGIRIAPDNQATIERCRVSGAAWHGIRYDDASPRILGNLIFGNARSGIYASGRTAAVVKGNLFYADEMGGMSCWFQNQDLIEGNTFAHHRLAALSILGASKPTVRRNIFYTNPIGVSRADIGDNSPFAKSDGSMLLEDNLFWANEHDIQKGHAPGAYEPVALDGRTGVAANPQFVAPTAKDFSLRADSPARRQGIGVADPVSFPSPWPLQPEESAIIPQGDTRDYRQWRDPAPSSR